VPHAVLILGAIQLIYESDKPGLWTSPIWQAFEILTYLRGEKIPQIRTMSAQNVMSDVENPHSNSTISTRQADEVALPTDGRVEQSNDNDQSGDTNSMIQLPSKDGSKDAQNTIQATANDESQLHASETSGEIEKEVTFYQSLANKVMDDDETLVAVAGKTARAVHQSLGPGLMEEERGRVETRSRQAILHVAYTDLRVKNLEKEVKKLRRDLQGLPEDFEISQSVGNPVFLHELKRASAPEFRLTEESRAVPPHLQPALEVLLVDRGPGSNETKTGDNANDQRSPELIRIRPRILARHLQKISGEVTEPRNPPRALDGKMQFSAVVFRKPFKIFCAFEKQIRASVAELEIEIEKKSNEVTKSEGKAQETQDTKRKHKEYDNNDLLIDLKLLIEFFDVDLKPTLELRSKIKDGTATTIEYEDLWHLFNLGDNVIQQSSVPKVYRVINFTVRTHPHTCFAGISKIGLLC